MTSSIQVLPTTYVDWYCRNCGHEHETNRKSYSYPVKCPMCEEEKTSHGFSKLPVNSVYCDSEPHQYNLIGNEKTIQVYMRAMTGEHCGFTMDPSDVPDCNDDPIEVTRQVLEYVNNYIYSSSKETISNVLEAMEKCKEQSDENMRINRIHELRESIVINSLEYFDLIDEKEEDT